MKTIGLTLYEFDELSKEVQQKIIEKERWNIMDQCMSCYDADYIKSLKEICHIFNIKLKQYSVNYCSYYFSMDIDQEYPIYEVDGAGIYLGDLKGKLLLRYIRNNIISYILKPKYYGKLVGQYPHIRHVKRYSNITRTCECPLTGMGYDMYFLIPFLELMEKPDMNITYLELMEKCMDAFFDTWHKEYVYWADDEDALREELHHNQYEGRLYYENGDVYVGPLNEIA